LLNQNEGRNLREVAAEVIQNDKTAKAEKSKQLFAMLW
jgi:regulatory factor X